MKSVSWIAFFLLALSALVPADSVSPVVSGRVVGSKGEPLAEVVLTMTGETGAPLTAVTGKSGSFRFVNLWPGKFTLACEREGFRSAVRQELVLEAGRSESLTVVLDLTPGHEEIQGSVRRAPLDPGAVATVARWNREDLRSGPVARTLTGLVARVPGAVTDRVDVAGRFAGQEFAFQGGGTTAADAAWVVDGIAVTDFTRPGSVPFRFQPLAYDEIAVSDGAADLSSPTGGLQFNFFTPTAGAVTGGEVYLSHADRAWKIDKSLPSDLAAQKTATGGAIVNPGLDRLGQYGVRLGGPLAGPTLTWTGAVNLQDVRGRTESGDIRADWLVHSFAKLVLNMGHSNGELLVLQDEQINRHAPQLTYPQQNDGSLYDQRNPALLVALKLQQRFGNVKANLQFDVLRSRQVVDPRGADVDSTGHLIGNELTRVTDPVMQLDANPYRNTKRNQFHVGIGGEYFREGVLGGNHAMRLGLDLSKASTKATILYPNQRAIQWPSLSATSGQTVLLVPDFVSDVYLKRYSAYLGDTSTFDRLTVSLGVRYDYEQAGLNDDITLPAFSWIDSGTVSDKTLFSGSLGELDVTAVDIPRPWKTISPRASVAIDLDGRKGALLRLSVARYATMGQQALAEALVPHRVIEAIWNDDGDGLVEYSEIGAATSAYNPHIATVDADTGLVVSQYALNLTAPKLDELTASLEKTIGTDFSARLGGFYRKHHHLLAVRGVLAGGLVETAANWVRQPDVTVNGSVVHAYARVEQPSGYYYFNLPRAYDRYLGLQLGLTKKWSHRWSGRATFVWQDWQKHRFADETYDGNNFDYFDGGVVAPSGLGVTGSGALLNARWLANVQFRVGLPWSFQLSGALTARDGFPIAYHTLATLTGLGRVAFYEADKKLGDDRYPSLWLADFGLERSFRAGSGATATLSAEVHNLGNRRTVVARQAQFGSTLDQTLAVVDQTVVQLGFRLKF